MQRDVLPGDEEILLHRGRVRRRAHIHLDHRHVERATDRFGERDTGRGKDERERPDGEPGAPHPWPVHASDRLEQQDVHDDDDEGDPPNAGDGRER